MHEYRETCILWSRIEGGGKEEGTKCARMQENMHTLEEDRGDFPGGIVSFAEGFGEGRRKSEKFMKHREYGKRKKA